MKQIVVALLGILSLTVSAGGAPQGPVSDIRLVLLIAVDQFRYDYLQRFRPGYTEGLKRLLSEGAVFTDANLEHYPTVTAIGHATMLSGATPSVSGIIGNDWFDRASGASVTSVSDGGVKPIGSDTASGASPQRLLVSTVGDELKLASPNTPGEAPRVIGLSLKDRSAILPVGRGADAAYWLDTKSGRFVTSTYYLESEPEWVRTFNQRRLSDAAAGQPWKPLFDPSTVLKQLPKEQGTALYEAVYGSPFGNTLLLDFAEATLLHERLGRRGATDLLTVSFSSNDSVGHTFGPDSPQVQDIALRTDRAIGQLLRTVDKLVGLRHTLIALTADHGVAPLPETLQQRKLPGGRITSKELFGPIEQALEARYGAGKWILATAGSSPYLNYDLMATSRIDAAEARRVAATAATAAPHVARVYTRDQLLRGDVADDRIGQRVLRGFNAQRSGDLEIILEPYWMRQATGTTHGTPYSYDAHIPLILMGPRVKAGTYGQHVALNDLAPTLSAVLGVETPAGSSGRVLTEALRPPDAPLDRPAGKRSTHLGRPRAPVDQ